MCACLCVYFGLALNLKKWLFQMMSRTHSHHTFDFLSMQRERRFEIKWNEWRRIRRRRKENNGKLCYRFFLVCATYENRNAVKAANPMTTTKNTVWIAFHIRINKYRLGHTFNTTMNAIIVWCFWFLLLIPLPLASRLNSECATLLKP